MNSDKRAGYPERASTVLTHDRAMTDNETLRQALQDLADEYDRLAQRAHDAGVAVFEAPYIAARRALEPDRDDT